jgi:cobalamin biosynthesis protein CobT
MATLDRSRFIALLQRLGAERDEDALAAARELDRAITESGVSWDDLLTPDSRSPAPVENDELSSEPDTDDEDELDDAEDEAAEEDDEKEEEEGEEDEEEVEEADTATATAPEEPRSANPEEDARTIERLLALKSLSQETRDELTGFQRDLAEGRLSSMDSRYIAALARRFGT